MFTSPAGPLGVSWLFAGTRRVCVRLLGFLFCPAACSSLTNLTVFPVETSYLVKMLLFLDLSTLLIAPLLRKAGLCRMRSASLALRALGPWQEAVGSCPRPQARPACPQRAAEPGPGRPWARPGPNPGRRGGPAEGPGAARPSTVCGAVRDCPVPRAGAEGPREGEPRGPACSAETRLPRGPASRSRRGGLRPGAQRSPPGAARKGVPETPAGRA